jgi:hypothetical protein
VGIPYSLVAR